MRIKVVTPERVLFDDEVTEAIIDTKSGQITVLPHHIPLISIIQAGEVLLRKGEEEIPLVLSGGVLEVGTEGVTILADTAEHVKEVDLERAQKAIEHAEELMKDKKFNVAEYATLQANLAKHRARLRSSKKWKK